jgi:DNA-directed RNA polymerase subunit beta'
LSVRFDGVAEIEDLKVVKSKDADGKGIKTVISRTCEIKVLDKKNSYCIKYKYHSLWFVSYDKRWSSFEKRRYSMSMGSI